jgi:dolichyl-phosphate beta-glucosyltransferase
VDTTGHQSTFPSSTIQGPAVSSFGVQPTATIAREFAAKSSGNEGPATRPGATRSALLSSVHARSSHQSPNEAAVHAVQFPADSTSQTGDQIGSTLVASPEKNPAVAQPVDLRSRRLPSAEFDSIAIELAKGAFALDLCIVVPMYNEANRIANSIKALACSALSGERVGFVFVDDGSTDNTVSVARSAIEEFALAQAQVLKLKANVGKGGAVRAGMLAAAASAHFVGYLDADLSLDPSDVAAAFTRMRASDCDVLVGDRIVDFSHQPKLRRFASLTFRSLASVAAPTGVRDTQCAMKLFRADVARNVFEPLQTNGFGFDVEVLVRSRAIGARIDELPIAWTHSEGSSVNAATESYRMMRDVLKVRRALLRR